MAFRMVIEEVFKTGEDTCIVAGLIHDGFILQDEWVKIREPLWDKRSSGFNAQVMKVDISPYTTLHTLRSAGLFLKYGTATSFGGRNLKAGQIITKWVPISEDV